MRYAYLSSCVMSFKDRDFLIKTLDSVIFSTPKSNQSIIGRLSDIRDHLDDCDQVFFCERE